MVTSRQQQYLDAMGIEVWRARQCGSTAADTTPVWQPSWRQPVAGISSWLLEQAVSQVSKPTTGQIPLVIVGDHVADDSAESLSLGGSATLLDAMLKAIDIDRKQLTIVELADENSDDKPLLGALSDISLRAILFLSALPVHEPADALMPHASSGQTCLGAPLIVSFHPYYLLANPEVKRSAWEDLKQVRSLLRDV